MGLTLLENNQIEAMAGMTLAKTAMFAAKNNLSGLEFAHGIPGTVGGGIYMNAGAYGGEMKDVAIETEFMSFDGSTRWIRGEEHDFGYRHSVFQNQEGVIVRTRFQLLPGEEKTIRQRIYELNEKRRASQPLDMPSAGSAYKRPVGGDAAALIDNAGLKGHRVGNAAVSEKHAGFVVNLGGATAEDVKNLLNDVSDRVFRESGIRLEPEVRIW
jgi:UDP-N-acetylmuramate dehydrogenase